jgi:hypothetical protein
MSPNPTVENTVTLKYRALERLSGWLKQAPFARSVRKHVVANARM